MKGIYILTIVLFAAFCFFLYSSIRSCNELEKIRNTNEVRISDQTLVTKTKVVHEKEMKNLLNSLSQKDKELKALKNELAKKSYKIVTVTKVVIKTKEKVVYKYVKSDRVTNGVYTKRLVHKGFLYGQASFDIGKLQAPWSYEMFPIKVKIHILHSISAKGPDKVGLRVKLLDKNNNEQDVRVEANTVYSNPKTVKWNLTVHPFTLELGVGMFMKTSQPQPTFGVTLGTSILKLNHGERNHWRFLSPGLFYSHPDFFGVYLSPASYNIGSAIPFFRDTYLTIGVGAGLNTSPKFDFFIFLGINTTL